MTSKKAKKSDDRRESRAFDEALRYMHPENIAKDFPDAKSKKAIAAVFDWLCLNGIAAWRLKNGTYSTVASRGGRHPVNRSLGTSDTVVLDNATFARAMKLLAPRT